MNPSFGRDYNGFTPAQQREFWKWVDLSVQSRRLPVAGKCYVCGYQSDTTYHAENFTRPYRDNTLWSLCGWCHWAVKMRQAMPHHWTLYRRALLSGLQAKCFTIDKLHGFIKTGILPATIIRRPLTRLAFDDMNLRRNPND